MTNTRTKDELMARLTEIHGWVTEALGVAFSGTKEPDPQKPEEYRNLIRSFKGWRTTAGMEIHKENNLVMASYALCYMLTTSVDMESETSPKFDAERVATLLARVQSEFTSFVNDGPGTPAHKHLKLAEYNTILDAYAQLLGVGEAYSKAQRNQSPPRAH